MKRITPFIIVFCFAIAPGKAQDRPPHEVQSMMIYNFLKYIQWPESTPGDFIIGVIGDDDIFNTLTKWYNNKERGGRKFIIKKFATVNDITDCQLLYIGKSMTSQFTGIKTKLKSKSTLTVASKNGLGRAGCCINFKVVDERLKFELNQSAVQKAKLKIASQLNSMAILI